jgi:hypothetical protein
MQTVSLKKQEKNLADYECSFGAEHFVPFVCSPLYGVYNSAYPATVLRIRKIQPYGKTSDTLGTLYGIAV